jgi:uncharacterized MAPEG superfamily protein
VAVFRGLFASRAGKAINSFSPDGTDVGGFGQRLTRAHLNCVEFLPAAGAVILAAAVAGRGAVTDPLAMPLLYARIAQSAVHVISTSVPMVMIRATLLVVQIAIVASWIFRLL